MRGKVVFYMKFVQHHRITPAYAGKSILHNPKYTGT